MKKIIKDLISKKEKEYKLSFDYKSITYNTTFYKHFIDKKYEGNHFKKDMLEYYIGFERDKNECAFLGYIPEDEMFYISLINSKSREGDNPKCFNPPLPEKGSMDFLIQLCISLSYIINSKFKKFELYDMAVIIRNEDWKKDKPLGWLKYFRNYSETAYSKYGFFIREGELELTDSEEGYLLFKKYMSVLKEFIQTNRLKDVLNEKEIIEILPEEQRYLETLTLENLLKTIIEDENLIYLYKKLLENEKLGSMINIQGEYYLSRYYYENLINDNDKVSNIKISM
jgi:hypothetical protein